MISDLPEGYLEFNVSMPLLLEAQLQSARKFDYYRQDKVLVNKYFLESLKDQFTREFNYNKC